MTSNALVDHHRWTKREAWLTLFTVLSTYGGLLGLLYLFMYFFHDVSMVFAIVWHLVVVGFGLLVILGYVLPNMRMDREFRFVVTSERIECTSPANRFGESYVVLIRDITAVEKKSRGEEGSYDWYLHTSDGRCLNLTPNYGNPIRRIVKVLRRLRPDLPEKWT
jgi:hypothetical protein